MQLLIGLQFDICYVIKTRVGFAIQKWQDFKTILAGFHLLFKIISNLKILENCQEYVYSELIYKTVKCKVINVKFLSRDLPFNNSAIMIK